MSPERLRNPSQGAPTPISPTLPPTEKAFADPGELSILGALAPM